MTSLQNIFEAVLKGDKARVLEQVQVALEAGENAEAILNSGLIPAMEKVGQLFEEGELFIPEMLMAAIAMKAALEKIKPLLMEVGIEASGKIVIGTVKGDLHDIGKNLVAMMLEGAGLEVIDLGADVSAEEFVDATKTHHPQILGMSALLTTTMPIMQETIQALRASDLRNSVKVIVGGAPVTEEFAEQIGADGFASDASRAVSLAKSLL